MSEAELRPELRTLLDAARSEVKRWGGTEVGYLHLAAVTAQRWPDTFATEFGEAARSRVQSLLERGHRSGAEADVVALLAAANGPSAVETVVARLHDELAPILAAEPESSERADESTDPALTPASGASLTEASAETADVDAAEAWALPARSARFAEVVRPDVPAIGREGLIDEILTWIARENPRVPLMVGPRGVGKTTLAAALAQRLQDDGYDGPLKGVAVVSTSADRILAGERATSLGRLLEDVPADVVLFLDDLDVLAGLAGQSVDLGVLTLLRAATRQDRRLVITADPGLAARIDVHDGTLWESLVLHQIPELPRPALHAVVDRQAAALAEAHGVTVSEEVKALALAPCDPDNPEVHPGLAVARLDGACVRAALRGDHTVVESDLGLAVGSGVLQTLDASLLSERLGLHVIGQTAAVDLVSKRLALTRARLDLRPERPDGVFLFVGPTGVGKTELSKAIAAEVLGDPASLIRLDMSEYAHDWALSRLVGPQPGYVGFTEPESWLTTRVLSRPNAVVLLDEIEKAHRTIWNAFLQVFDAGRLSDARGNVADFSNTIIVMTSNLGADAFGREAIGFGGQEALGAQAENRVLATVREVMAPELVNRLDAVVVFQQLSEAAIHDIARKEIAAACDRLAERGYLLTVEPDAVDLIATTGYDPTYGGRHLQRNIERLLLQPLVAEGGRRLTATASGDHITWRPT